MSDKVERPAEEGGSGPLVTIGIPVYNGANHLAAALQSVLEQDYRHLEVVVCDNASEDNSPDIVTSFAARDPRVRLVKNGTNIGLLPNFRRVRDEARGKYFGWLGHDDLLSDPSYLSTAVGFLEEHPDVALCHTWISMLKPSGETEVIRFPELHPDRPWAEARRDLFRWPQDWLEMCSHGIFRREVLAALPIPERTRTRRPHVFCWEINTLTALATRARIVALPEPLRTYRSSPGSAARQMGRSVSPFDLVLLDLETKLNLALRAARLPAPYGERARLAATALGNFRDNTFRRRFDHRTAIRLVEQELEMLRAAAGDRFKLIEYLLGEIQARQELLAGRGEDPGSFAPAAPEPLPEMKAPLERPRRSALSNFFRPPSPAQVRWYAELNFLIDGLRRYCDRQLAEIERAEGEAQALLSRL